MRNEATVKHLHPILYTLLGHKALERGRRTPVALKLHLTLFKVDLQPSAPLLQLLEEGLLSHLVKIVRYIITVLHKL